MNGTKGVLSSLGIMGPVLSAVVLLLNTYVFKAEVVLSSDITSIIDTVGIIAAIVTGIIGRFKATKQIVIGGAAKMVLPLALIGTVGTLAACASDGGPPPINKSAVAAQQSAGVLFNAGAVLVNVCLFDKASSAGSAVDASFKGTANTLDQANASIQAGDTDAANILIDTAKAALTNVQTILAALQPTPTQAVAVREATPPSPKKPDFNEIIVMVNQYLPIILAGGTEIANLVKSFIDSVKAPNADVSVEAVATANAAMHASLANWERAACVN